jgi:hypothetical protein
MNEPILFAFGFGMTFLCLAGSYVWLRGRFRPLSGTDEGDRIAGEV